MFGLSALASKAIAGAIVASLLLAGALYIKHVIAENAMLASQVDQAVAVNKANVAAFAEYKDIQAKTLDALAAQHAADQKRLQNASKLKQEIARAPKTDDAPVAPVLSRTLDALRVRNEPAANPSPN